MHCSAPPRISTTTRLVALALCLALFVRHSDAVHAHRRLRHQVDPAAEPEAPTVGPSPVLVDDSGSWQLADGSQLTDTAQPVAQATNSSETASSPGSSDGIHQAQVDLKETLPDAAAAAAAHHSTPMAGFVIIGAMAIVCVGVAAGIARRKQQAVGESH